MAINAMRRHLLLRHRLAIAAGVGVVASLALSAPVVAAPAIAWSRTASIAESGSTTLGVSLALSADGHTLVASSESDNIVYTQSGGSWVRRSVLPGAPASALAISGNGSTILVGDISVNSYTGAVLVYVRRGDNWVRQATIPDPDASQGANFGSSVSVSADGNTALIGTNFSQQDPEVADMFYVRSGSTWRLAQVVHQPESGLIDFGGGVLSGDGQTALINWGDGNGSEPFATATFIRSGLTWAEQGPRITEPFADGGSTAAALSANGTTAVITTQSSGRSYQALQVARVSIFTRTGTSWTQQQVISVPGTTGADYSYAPTVAISSDAHTLVIGSRSQFAGRGTGLIYTEVHGAWVQTATLPAPGTEKTESPFAVQVALSGAGTTAVLGEPGASNAKGMLGVYASHVVLTHAQWVWLRSVFIPRHYSPALRARAWTILTSNPNAAYALVERYAPTALR